MAAKFLLLLVTFINTLASVRAITSRNVAVFGDSISVGYNCPGYLGPNAASLPGQHIDENWATGTNTALVHSILSRLDAGGGVKGTDYAHEGDRMIEVLNNQVVQIDNTVDLGILEIGANDFCGATALSITTSTADFTSQFSQVCTTFFSTAAPNAKLVVFSIPNLYSLWDTLHADPTYGAYAQSTWSTYNICPTMLANPGDISSTGVDYRAAATVKLQALNQALSDVCATLANCIFDNNLFYNVQFNVVDFSTLDFFHPSCYDPSTGQGRIANVAWDFLTTTVGEAPLSERRRLRFI